MRLFRVQLKYNYMCNCSECLGTTFEICDRSHVLIRDQQLSESDKPGLAPLKMSPDVVRPFLSVYGWQPRLEPPTSLQVKVAPG